MHWNEEIRKDFPFLVENKDIIYLDNACMSLRPRPVLEAVNYYYTKLSACAGRSNHRLARKLTNEVQTARKVMAKWIGAASEKEVIFTRNTTEGLNLVANSLRWNSGDVVVISDKEHNSNLVPWLKLKEERGIELRIMKTSRSNEYEASELDRQLDERVKLVSVVMTSNLDGASLPIAEIAKKAHKYGALVLVDAAQSMPHKTVKVKKLGVDFLAFSGHKMMGPTGTGVLWGKKHLLEELDSFLVGGDTVEYTTYENYEMLPVPEKFEAGLQDYAGILGMAAAVNYLEEISRQKIEDHEIKLNEQLTETLRSLERIRIIGPIEAGKRGGIASFTIEGADVHQVAMMLDETAKIMVRSGQHCVHSWFNARGIEKSLRVSFYAYNTSEEVERFGAALKNILKVI